MKIKKSILSILFLYVLYLLIRYPTESTLLAKDGLLIWFHTMLPTLMPFMILSTLMVSMHLTDFLGPKRYCIVMGFLCGFPMGAKIVNDLYKTDQLSQKEAELLMGFCNNLGPIFMLNFALPAMNIENPFYYLIGFYGIPFLYGMLLLNSQKFAPTESSTHILKCEKDIHLLYHIDDAIQCAIHSITTLGGYMILFNLLYIIPQALHLPTSLRCVFEICGGLSLHPKPSLWLLGLIPLGGLSCLVQTYSVIKDSSLSYSTYLKHKINLSILTFIYFVIITYIVGFEYF